MTKPDAIALLEVVNLSVSVTRGGAAVQILRGVNYCIYPGEALAIIGDPGSGKTLHALSVMWQLPPEAEITSGSVLYKGRDLETATEEELRGVGMSMVFQEPITSLEPAVAIGLQLAELVMRQKGLSYEQALPYCEKLLEKAGLAAPEVLLDQSPQNFSGEVRERAMVALALASDPDLIIVDEPAASLDGAAQEQLLNLLDSLKNESGISLALLTHDPAIAAKHADYVLVLYAGRVMERGPAAEFFKSPSHPYSRALLNLPPEISGSPDGQLITAEVLPHSFDRNSSGCPFAPRCPEGFEKCRSHEPPEFVTGERCASKCWRSEPGFKIAAAPVSRKKALFVYSAAVLGTLCGSFAVLVFFGVNSLKSGRPELSYGFNFQSASLKAAGYFDYLENSGGVIAKKTAGIVRKLTGRPEPPPAPVTAHLKQYKSGNAPPPQQEDLKTIYNAPYSSSRGGSSSRVNNYSSEPDSGPGQLGAPARNKSAGNAALPIPGGTGPLGQAGPDAFNRSATIAGNNNYASPGPAKGPGPQQAAQAAPAKPVAKNSGIFGSDLENLREKSVSNFNDQISRNGVGTPSGGGSSGGGASGGGTPPKTPPAAGTPAAQTAKTQTVASSSSTISGVNSKSLFNTVVADMRNGTNTNLAAGANSAVNPPDPGAAQDATAEDDDDFDVLPIERYAALHDELLTAFRKDEEIYGAMGDLSRLPCIDNPDCVAKELDLNRDYITMTTASGVVIARGYKKIGKKWQVVTISVKQNQGAAE